MHGEHGGECGDGDVYGLHDVEACRVKAREVGDLAIRRSRDSGEQRAIGCGGDPTALVYAGDR
ncbi:hypothetical protein TorRG33x02_180970 [Trema orientale]|uniref:Uncharacterized protein n=1 Tax=Trema orientale TaxID=63057 RepID=A0A2P5EKF7_TREOI|nr:hypothetical protein TorRG33x02_180970 [Trema orientale]